eukprot:TRINITY_DN87658_c0_g1_i1.p1 TRINITY_DN87658_c0_g1~~TRINITY_DN87658_c0_g1_i1.p1  ORF type:complete len:172 (-),score=40.18 TRINITY_DN87658_c0_g1_i1:14-529(-)
MLSAMARAVFTSVLAALAWEARAEDWGNLKPGTPAYTLLVCDACKIVMGRLVKDVKYLVETRKMWTSDQLNSRLALACEDPQHPTGTGVDACNAFIHHNANLVKAEVSSRWDEDSEEFEEDIVPKEFCRDKAFICKDGKMGLNEMMNFEQKKEADLKAEREEKEKRNTKKG